MEAVPADGYEFNRWEGDVTETSEAIISLTMDSDKTVTAVLSEKPTNWWLIILAAAGGIAVIGLAAWIMIRQRSR